MINRKKQNCYLCGKNKLVIIRTKLRHNISRNVLECKNCGIIYLEPKESDLKDFYSYDYRNLYSPVISRALDSREVFDIYFPYQQQRIDELQKIISSHMRVLDIGCSAGHFLYTIKNSVQECIGIEFNKENAIFVEKELGIKVYTDPIEKTDLPHEYFDMITIYQAFEHIVDPIGFLKIIYKYLKPDGFICIEVPNIQDALISIYNIESFAEFYYREPHVFYYSPKTLSMVLERGGFKGNTKLIQQCNFINHINWNLTGRPQKSAEIAWCIPKLISSESVRKEITNEFNRWIQRVDKEYKELLLKNSIGDTLLYTGQKA